MKRIYRYIHKVAAAFFASAAILTPFTASHAVKAYPFPITVEQPDGTTVQIRLEGNETNHTAYSLDGRMMVRDVNGFLVYATEEQKRLSEMDTRALGDTPKYVFPGTAFPNTGEPRALVVLVEFADNSFRMKDPHTFYDNQLNGETYTQYGAQKSARTYFIENSGGLFRPHFDVLGPVKLSKPMEYYGQNDSRGDDTNPDEMVIEACTALAASNDMSVYDNDADGFIDNVFVIYAGYGEADSYIANTVWPHSADLTVDFKYSVEELPDFNGVKPNRYGCTCELVKKEDRPDGIGTFVHEFSHVLGLPDLYHTLFNRDGTPGAWSVIDSGSYNDKGLNPPNYSVYERLALNWIDPVPFTSSGDYALNPIFTHNQAYIIPTKDENEFYLLENRQGHGGDQFIPGHGMLIWHIQFDEEKWRKNVVNNTISHQCVDLVEADGIQGSKTAGADAWPGTSLNRSFGFATTPQMKSWDGDNLNTEITGISENNGIISFHVALTGDTGMADISADKGVVRVHGRTLSTAGDETFAVYDVSGVLIGNLTAECPLSISSSGIYFVQSENRTEKILVK